MRKYMCHNCNSTNDEDKWNVKSEYRLPKDLHYGHFVCPTCDQELSEDDIEAI